MAFFLFVVLPGVVFAENWDRFRGPNGAGQSDDAEIPTKWEADNFLWKQPLPGIGHSSPVIWGDRLFITSGDASTGAQIVSAFDARSGKPLWEKRFDASTYRLNDLNSFASSTPAVDAQHIYSMWLDNGKVTLVALNHNGGEVWRADAGQFEENHGFGESPVVVDGLVWLATDSEAESALAAFDCQTGQRRWHIARESGTTAYSTPCVLDLSAANKQLVFTSTTAGLTAIDTSTGEAAWQGFTDALPARCVASPIVAGGLVIATSGQGGNGKYLVAVQPGNGDEPPQEVYRLQQGVPQVPTPVAAGDLLFMWHDRGTVSCYDLATGKQHWRERIGGDFHSSPIRIGNRIFGTSRSGDVIVLAADKKFQLLARNSLNELCHATPAVANGRLYIRTESSLMCVGAPGN